MTARVAARSAVVLGALAVLAVPVAVGASHEVSGLALVRALYYATPVSVVLGLAAALLARRARLATFRSVYAARTVPVRAARVLAWLGVYAGVTTALAIGVYWILRARR